MTPPKRPLLVDPPAWLISAQSDLKLARLAHNQEDILPEQICFHAQQAVEKAFKAVLIAAKADFPLTHDLEELLDICVDAGIDVPVELLDVGCLSPYAVETRYPGFWAPIEEADVNEALLFAERALNWAQGYVMNRGGGN
jgi:HEPN domain-containing protein